MTLGERVVAASRAVDEANARLLAEPTVANAAELGRRIAELAHVLVDATGLPDLPPPDSERAGSTEPAPSPCRPGERTP